MIGWHNREKDMIPTKEFVFNFLKNASSYEWNLQGMGLLKTYLPDNQRLHIWDSRFRFKNVSMIHDHLQWGLHSKIIVGDLENIRYKIVTEGTDAKTYKYVTLKPGFGLHFLSKPNFCLLQAQASERYLEGDSYTQEPSEIHETNAVDGTVTIITKTLTSNDAARVFWPADKLFGSAEPRTPIATASEVKEITNHALNVWFS